MTISLTIMGIVVSIISLDFEKRSIDLQNRELEIIYSSYLPVFNVMSIDHKSKYIIDGVRYSPCIEYLIINNGGVIHDAYLRTEATIDIILYDDVTNNKIVITIDNMQRFLKSYSYYSADTQSFIIKREYDNRYIELRNFLSKKLKDYYQEYYVSINTIDFINIQYFDFEQRFHNDWYELSGGELSERNPPISNAILMLYVTSATNEEIYDIIVEKLDEIIANR